MSWPSTWSPGRGVAHLDSLEAKDPGALDRALADFSFGADTAKEMVLDHREFVREYRTLGLRPGDLGPEPCGAMRTGNRLDRAVLDALRVAAVAVGGYKC